MQQLWTWISAHPLLAYLAGSAVLSLLWYRVRGAVWPGVETERLPLAGRVLQALVETACNAPGAVRAALGSGGDPPGRRVPTLPPVGLGVLALLCLAACGPVRSGATVLTPGAPPPGRCDVPGATRCDGARVLVCSASGRLWDALPGECAYGCLESDAGARCVARDAGVGE